MEETTTQHIQKHLPQSWEAFSSQCEVQRRKGPVWLEFSEAFQSAVHQLPPIQGSLKEHRFHLALTSLTREAGPCAARVQGVSFGVRQILAGIAALLCY